MRTFSSTVHHPSAPSGHYSDIAEDPRLIMYLGDEPTKEWLRALVGGHGIMGVAARVEAPERFLEDFVKTGADSIAEWPHRVHMPVTDPKVEAGKR
jgi:hypothetical protein